MTTQSSAWSPAGSEPLPLSADILHAEVAGLFEVAQMGWRDRGQTLTFTGRLLHDADTTYEELVRRFRPHGYTPLLRRERGRDVLLATPGLIVEGSAGNPWLNVLLFLATVLTTVAAGSMLERGEDLFRALLAGDAGRVVSAFRTGAPFAVTLLLILGVHELGHYFAARYHRVRATLPYFIPLPFGSLGTLGAFIAVRSPMKNRTVLFDIGLAGPLAGLVVAVPLFVVGLLNSFPVPYFDIAHGMTLRMLGSSLLVKGLVGLFGDVPVGQTLALHPIFFAAWFGLLITGINLLPIGQLDGGHVGYALWAGRAHILARVVLVLLLVAGVVVSTTWFFWAFFVMLGGVRHAPPLNDISGLNRPRKLLAVLTIILFFLLVVPDPFLF